MKKFLHIFFVTLGVIFFFIILIGVYFYITDPFHLKPLLFNDTNSVDSSVDKPPVQETTLETPSVDPADGPSDRAPEQVPPNDPNVVEPADDSVDKHPMLNERQEAVLETFGIDPADVPSEITAEQEACFEATLGNERVAEIKAGDVPTVMDYFKAKGCIE